MTISSTTTRVSYSGNGVTTAFSFPYYFLANGDLTVILVVDATGVETTKTITTHYTVSGAGNPVGGTVTMLTAPASGETLIILREVDLTQETDWVDNDPLPASSIENAVDKLTMATQQLNEKFSRSILFSQGAGTTGIFIEEEPEANATLVFNADADGIVNGPTTTEIEDAEANAAAAAASALAAQTAEANAETAEANAEAALATIQQTIASALWNDITRISTNTALDDTHNGHLIVVDTSGGAVTVTMPLLATVGEPFNCGIRKDTGDANAVTIARSGSDVFDDGDTSLSIVSVDAGYVLVGDTDTSPDEWVSTFFGASAGNWVADTFSGDGAETEFTLSSAPGSANNCFVMVSGVVQAPTTDYTVSGTTLTFTSAPAIGTDNIRVRIGTSLSIGTPSDGTVSTAKIVDANVTFAKLAAAAVVTEAEGISSNDNDTTLPTSAAVKDYADSLFSTRVEQTVAASSGATVAVTAPAAITNPKRVTIVPVAVSGNGTNNWTLKIGPSGGVVATGYTASAARPGVGDATASTSFLININTQASDTHGGAVVLHRLDSATNLWGLSGQVLRNSATPLCVSSGSIALAGVLNKLEFGFSSTDNFDGAGSFYIIWEQ